MQNTHTKWKKKNNNNNNNILTQCDGVKNMPEKCKNYVKVPVNVTNVLPSPNSTSRFLAHGG